MFDSVWFWIAVSAGFIIFAVIIHYIVWKRYVYTCPKCGNVFRPARFVTSLTAVNAAEYRRMKCTRCGEVDYMEARRSKKSAEGR